jgi:hypothetical protein
VASTYEQINAQGYSYIPFPHLDFTWKGYTWFSAQSQSWFEYWTFYNQGDTVIDNTTYHKIAANTYLREDSLKRVYFTNRNFAMNEKLLYDFSLSAGDTLRSGQTTFQIDSVDTIEYQGVLRRTLYSHWHNGALRGNDVWIEGIGSNRGPLGVWHMYSGPGHHSVLCQASENSFVKFHTNDELANNCSYYSSSEEPSFLSYHIYPNPTNDKLIINPENHAAIDVSVYDISGNCLLVQKNVFSFPAGISIKHLSQGYYILKLINPEGISFSSRFVITK